ncbi:MAG TPA: glycoside hydrolase family 43 protein [Acidimicrobiales bacterium]|nr:glycoside hydrolase family 43 protein [Acidimicrobiales bacterium]
MTGGRPSVSRALARRRALVRALAVALGVVGALAWTPRAGAAPHDGSGAGAPVYDADAPDPDVILVGSTYYAYTTGTDLKDIPVLASTDLQHWQSAGDALPALPSWSTFGQSWAPGVVALGGTYVMYYSTEVAATGQDCISLATATTPTGPFVDNSSTPFICQAQLGGSIDPQPFVDTNGRLFLYWKSNTDPPSSASIWVAELTADGTALTSGPEPVLGADQSWESTVESPYMVDEAGRYVLFYSGGAWNSAGYGVGYAECAGPFGPCTKPQGTPLLHSETARLGPGGESLVEDASGNWWMAYAAWDGPASAYSYGDGDFRSLWVAPVTFSGGTPVVDAGQAPEGYRLVASDGGVFPFGGASFLGSMGGRHLDAPVVGAAADAATGGYWEVAADGGIFAFGAPFYGSMGGRRLAAPVVGMAPTPDGGGYWLVASDGGVFAFGDAGFHGSTGGIHLVAPVTGMAAAPRGGGYWLVASDGGVFAFGAAPFYGSTGGFPLAAPVTGITVLPQGGGYWLVCTNGRLFPYGAATVFGSVQGVALAKPVKALVPGPGGAGYWEVAADGGIFAFGDAAYLGSTGGIRLAAPVVAAMAS